MDNTRNPEVNKIQNKLYKALRMSEPESNELSIIKSNLRSYNKILRSLIKDAKQSYCKSCFQNFKHNQQLVKNMGNRCVGRN